MSFIDIAIIVTAILIVLSAMGRWIYKKIKHIPTSECCNCHKNSKNLVKMYHKTYKNR